MRFAPPIEESSRRACDGVCECWSDGDVDDAGMQAIYFARQKVNRCRLAMLSGPLILLAACQLNVSLRRRGFSVRHSSKRLLLPIALELRRTLSGSLRIHISVVAPAHRPPAPEHQSVIAVVVHSRPSFAASQPFTHCCWPSASDPPPPPTQQPSLTSRFCAVSIHVPPRRRYCHAPDTRSRIRLFQILGSTRPPFAPRPVPSDNLCLAQLVPAH